MLDRAIMTTAINPGLAGAPLFDADGRAPRRRLAGPGRGRAATAWPSPSTSTCRAARGDGGGAGPPAPRARAWAGIYPQGFDGGVVLTGVVPGGPADQAGLARGDLVLSVDGAARRRRCASCTAPLWRKGAGRDR